jgi:nucleotide-binding universal stress UspA family protein
VTDAVSSPQKYLVPVNFSRKSELALEFALTYATSQGLIPEVYLFHVYEGSTKDFRLLDRVNIELMERMRHVVVNTINRLRHKGVNPNVHDVHRRLDAGKAPEKILEMADGLQPEILIMGAPTSGAFKKLVTAAPCTLVLVREKGYP